MVWGKEPLYLMKFYFETDPLKEKDLGKRMLDLLFLAVLLTVSGGVIWLIGKIGP